MSKMFSYDNAVSPVIGILLMLVVTLVIAAVVSGFAGGLVSGQSKTPQAQITGKLSIGDGFSIKHAGGDPLVTNDLVIVLKNSRLFGPDIEEKSAQNLSHELILNSKNIPWVDPTTKALNVKSFNPGESVSVTASNCNCNTLQPKVADDPTLCFSNTDNIGKNFIMEVSDAKSGKLISRSEVPITS